MDESEDRIEGTEGKRSGLVILGILGAGLAQASVTTIAERLLGLPEAISFGLGFLALFGCLIPVIRSLARSGGNEPPPVGRLLAGAVLGSIAGGAIFWLLG